jgi:hypothetical protein
MEGALSVGPSSQGGIGARVRDGGQMSVVLVTHTPAITPRVVASFGVSESPQQPMATCLAPCA